MDKTKTTNEQNVHIWHQTSNSTFPILYRATVLIVLNKTFLQNKQEKAEKNQFCQQSQQRK